MKHLHITAGRVVAVTFPADAGAAAFHGDYIVAMPEDSPVSVPDLEPAEAEPVAVRPGFFGAPAKFAAAGLSGYTAL